MWNDKETDIDLLGHRTLASTITTLILEKDLSPLTIGIYGDWGAGKSSLLEMIRANLKDQKEICCITFNGWLFQGYEDTKSVLMEAILTELQKCQPTDEKLKEMTKEALARVDWLKVIRHSAGAAWTAFTGIPDPALLSGLFTKLQELASHPGDTLKSEEVKSLTESFKSALKEAPKKTVPQEIQAFRKDFEALLKTAKVEQLVVLVDDLDRCLPASTIETLEAIRLFFHVPGTVFILAVDEAMIAYAVRKHFSDLPVSVGQGDHTKNYLEKLIQVPFRVPPLGKTETRTYVTLLLAEHALRADADSVKKLRAQAAATFARPWEGKKLDEAIIKTALGELPEALKSPLLLADRISNVLAEGLNGNPRQIKRFLNTLMVRLRVATAHGLDDVIKQDALAKLMLLERFAEPTFKDLMMRSGQTADGKVPDLKALETFDRHSQATTGKGSKAKGKDPVTQCPAEWLANDWLLAWAKIEPVLGEIDLRPYFYISREKSAGFTTDSGLVDGLEQLASQLASGQPLILSGLKDAIKNLSSAEAQKLFRHLADKARQATDWKTKPKEIDGLYELCRQHQELQTELVSVFANLPIAELGVWAASGIKSVYTETAAKQQFQTLLANWKTQTDNPSLQKAVNSIGDL